MDEIPTVQIVEAVLIGIVSVGMTIEIMSRGVLHSILVVGILKDVRTCGTTRTRDLHNIPPC